MKKSVKGSSSKNQTIVPMYKASQLTKNSSKDLWVAFPAGSTPKNGLVYGSKLTRDRVRSLASKEFNVRIQEIRSRRVKNMENRRLTNRW